MVNSIVNRHDLFGEHNTDGEVHGVINHGFANQLHAMISIILGRLL